MNLFLHCKKNLLFLPFFFLITMSASDAQENRTIDGSNNNLQNTDWGAVGTDQLTIVSNGFADGVSSPFREDRPNPRIISNTIFTQVESIPDPLNLSDFAWVWGQFIDHDITLSPEDPDSSLEIPIPIGDAHFDPDSLGTVALIANRSVYNTTGSTAEDGRRTFPSMITAFIDGSTVYGSDEERANWLRSFENGKLKMSLGNLLPYNTLSGEFGDPVDENAPEMANANPSIDLWFVAGDVRANENSLLTVIHTLFVREHNRQCDILALDNPDWSDEEIYQHVRKIVGGRIEAIVYNEWLPSLGIDLGAYSGYDASVNPGIMNVFSTAAYRYGHTVINENILRLNNDGSVFEDGHLLLKDAFFNPWVIIDSHGIDVLLKGMSRQVEQDLDSKMVDGLRNFLFGPPGAGGLDLASLNINRGRERGLADYNTIRVDFGLNPYDRFSEISSDSVLNNKLSDLYGDINQIDAWVGFLSESHMPNSLYSESVFTIVKRQFANLRDGDRYYFENDPQLSAEEVDDIRNTRLADIIMRNTDVTGLQANVFIARADLLTEPDTVLISGQVVTDFGDRVEGVTISMNDGSKEMTSEEGQYTFIAQPNTLYTIDASKDNDYLNGISTLDVVLIQKHALGIKALDSPYKIIGADINSDGKISAVDLVDMRKLILGITPDFADNDSWRFVVEDQSFNDPSNPFPFVEEISLDMETEDIKGMNFVAVKIGDVTGDAIANTQMIAAPRSLQTLRLSIDDTMVDAGEVVDVVVRAKDFVDITAYQFTMDIEGLTLENISSGAVAMTKANVAILDQHTITATWYNTIGVSSEDVLFTMTFRATDDIVLSDAIGLSSRVTRSVAYTASEERLNLELEYSSNDTPSFALYQNEPNPFSSLTTISFELTEAGPATLSIYDVTGKIIMERTLECLKGVNMIQIDKEELQSTGVLYYQLTRGGYQVTKKMIAVD